MDGSEKPPESIIKSEDNNNNCSSRSTTKEGDEEVVGVVSDLGTSENPPNQESPPCSIPTINFADFVSLLSPNNVENCLCCSTPLSSSAPPSLLPERRRQILKSFCDILNLPFNPGGDEEEHAHSDDDDEKCDDEDETKKDEFPFCFHCTNKKVLLLTLVHGKLEVLQAQFNQLKNNILKDVVRGFVSNIVVDKKIPVHVIRDSRICERMFHLFKRHSERKVEKNMLNSEVQTDISSVFTPLLNPSAVASLLENTSTTSSPNNRRKRLPPRKPDSVSSNSRSYNSTRYSRSANLNSHADLDYKLSPLKSTTPSTYCNNNNALKNTQDIEESIVPFDEHLSGGGMFPFDDNGILNLEHDTYMHSTDYYSPTKPNYVQHTTMNGFSINKEFQNTLMDGYDHESSIGAESTAPPKTSPLTYTELDVKRSPRAHHKASTKFATCEVCDKNILKRNMKLHMEQIHGGDKLVYKCRGCDRQFSRRDHFLSHEDRHIVNSKLIYFCHRCVEEEELITSKSAYVSHCIQVHGIEDDVVEYFYFCDKEDCGKSYKVREDFINHVKSHWALAESNNCSVCDKIFADKDRLVTHQIKAHEVNSIYYDCQFCYKGFDEESDFSRHLLFHKVKIPEELKYHCDKCEKSFETQNRLRRHIYTVHVRVRSKVGKSISNHSKDVQKNSITETDQDDDDSIVDCDFPCEECGKSYSNDKKLQKHIQKHHGKGRRKRHRDVTSPSSDDDVPDAGQVDADKEDEDYPVPGRSKRKRRHKSFNKTTTKTKTDSTGLNKTCSLCPLRWKASIDLRRHMVKSHRKEYLKRGQVHCIVCFNVFSGQQELDDHCEEKHSRSKCHICNKQLQHTGLLKQHMERHKAHPFVCKLCDQGFSSKGVLGQHLTKMHSKRKDSDDFDDNNTFSPAHSLSFDQNSIDLDSIDLFQI